MEKGSLFYKESLKYNPVGYIVSIVTLAIIALFLGYFYTGLTIIMPFVYINILLPIGFGLILGLINRVLGRLTQNRHKKSRMVQALISGVLANYFQWTAYVYYVFNGELPSLAQYLSSLHWIVVPQNFFPAIVEINKVGLWAVFDIPFTGLGLAAIWVIEALIIIALPVIAVYQTKVYPYSETLGKWFPKYILHKDFEYLASPSKMLKDLQTDVLAALKNLEKGFGHRHSKIHLHYHKDDETAYVSVESVTIEGQGKGKTQKNTLISNFVIDRQTAEQILSAYGNMRNPKY